LRRQAQLRHIRSDLRLADIRGNIDTRLRKLDDGDFDAIVLAAAGLRRLGLAGRVTHTLPFDVMLPAVGQGALAIECRSDDSATLAAVAPIDDPSTHAAVLAERALLAHLRGGCMAPVGALAKAEGDHTCLTAVVMSIDGKQRLFVDDAMPVADGEAAEALGRRVATALLAQGAADLIAQLRA
jgi:hydroxymethylbilane synthase